MISSVSDVRGAGDSFDGYNFVHKVGSSDQICAFCFYPRLHFNVPCPIIVNRYSRLPFLARQLL